MADKKPTRGDAVRQAVDEAFQAAAGQAQQFGRERAQEIVDELGGAANRLRDALEDLRPPTADDIRALREEVKALAERVAALEEAKAAKPKRAPRPRAAGSSSRAKAG
jgi:polyhydroxyalkanoate synthesis regulator phasin